jgi:ABC-type polysaccharide/polyol phosphate export permease
MTLTTPKRVPVDTGSDSVSTIDLVERTPTGPPVALGGSSWGELWARRELLKSLTQRELRGKYKRSMLGWAWSMLNPISSLIIYTVVFSLIFTGGKIIGTPSGIENYTLYLACGLLPWNFLAGAVGTSTGSLLAQSGLLKKVYFPREFVVGSTVLSWLVSFAIELSVLTFAFALTGKLRWELLPMLLVIMSLQTLLILGISLGLSALNVYFRDVQHLLGIFLQVWFYLTPIVYPLSLIKEKSETAAAWYSINPMVHVSNAYRDVLYHGRFPTGQSLGFMALSAVISLVVGGVFFRRLEPRLAEEL